MADLERLRGIVGRLSKLNNVTLYQLNSIQFNSFLVLCSIQSKIFPVYIFLNCFLNCFLKTKCERHLEVIHLEIVVSNNLKLIEF